MLKTSCTILTSFNFKLDLPAVWFQLFDCFQQSETIFLRTVNEVFGIYGTQ